MRVPAAIGPMIATIGTTGMTIAIMTGIMIATGAIDRSIGALTLPVPMRIAPRPIARTGDRCLAVPEGRSSSAG